MNDGNVNVYLGVKGATCTVVTTIDTSRHQVSIFIFILIYPITQHHGIAAVIVDVGFKHITWYVVTQAVCTAKDAVQDDC